MESPDLSDLETGLVLIVGAFNEYASGDEDSKTLSKDEFRKMIREQFPVIFKKEDTDKLMGKLDKNEDNLIDFEEYMHLISKLAAGSYRVMSAMGDKK